MGKTLQVRNVPETLHRNLKALAAREGVSLSDLVLEELRRMGERPSRRDLFERLKRRRRVALASSVAEIIAAERYDR